MKHILAENMRRFGTKNLTEAATVTKPTNLGDDIIGRTVSMWSNKSQTVEGMDIGIADLKKIGANVKIVAIDLSDVEKVKAYNAGEAVTISEEFFFYKGDTKFFSMGMSPRPYYNRWLVDQLNKTYYSK